MERDLGNVSTRYQDTSTSSSTDIGSVSSGSTRAVDRIINSSVIRRRVVEGRNAIAAEKYVSPNLQEANQVFGQNIGGSQASIQIGGETKKTSALRDMMASQPVLGTIPEDSLIFKNDVSTAKANPIVMYAAIGIGAILIYKYFIK
jgi:hypothetical protein